MIDVYHGSCLDLASMVALCNAMLTDPPYREHVHKNAVSHGTKGPSVARDLGFAHLDEELRTFIGWCASQVKGWSLIFSDCESTHLWRAACEAAGAEYIRPTPWIRWSQPQKSGDRPTTGCEMTTIYHATDGGKPIKKRWNGPGNLIAYRHEEVNDDEEGDIPPQDSWEHKALRQSKTDPKHGTEKPLDQALDHVCYFTQPEQRAFDPTCGVATYAVACLLLDRDFLGAELDPKFFDKGQSRIAAAQAGSFNERDAERIQRWLVATKDEASKVPEPRGTEKQKKMMLRTWERAQRRLADVKRVQEKIK